MREETPERLFALDCRFRAAAATYDQLPPPEAMNEIAFAGRSNVGKSSLVNALVGRKALARTSSKPGSTQTINFFDLGGRLMLVDLPGYGFARVSKDTRAGWSDMIKDYLRGRPNLRRVCLLIDARHGPKPGDEDIMKLLDQSALVYQIVLTKADAVKPTARADLLAGVQSMIHKRPAAHPTVLVTSAETGEGIAELQTELAAFA